MKVSRARASALLFAGAALGTTGRPARAQTNATLTLIGALPIKAALDELIPRFETASGTSIAVKYDGPAAAKNIVAGEAFDVVIAGAPAVDGLVKGGFVLADSQAILGTTMAEVAYRSGAARPDISTADALKALLRKAKTISFSDPAGGGASSIYFAGIIKALGISDDVQRKAILTKTGEGAFPVGDGRAEIGIAQSGEIAMVPGVAGVPLFPADPQSKSTFVVGISTKSTQLDAARALVRFILSPDGSAIRTSKGLSVGP